jgi:hypothetical protein
MSAPQPIRFGHHSVAVLSAALLGSTIVAVVLTAGLAIDTIQQPMGAAWLATMAIAIWIGVFIVALPGAAIILSLIWPVTRRRTAASDAVCVMAGATGGIILAPLASSRMQGASFRQILLFAAIGAALALIYLVVAARLGRKPSAAIRTETPPRVNGDQLDLGL